MAARALTLSVLLVLTADCAVANEPAGACRATFPDGVLDLAPLDGLAHPDGRATFANFAFAKIGGINYNLTFNPCSGFHCNTDSAAAACASDVFSIGLSYDLGSQLQSNISRSANGTLQLRYASIDKPQGKDFVTIVTLACSPAGTGDSVTGVKLSDSSGLLTFQLNSQHCCLIPSSASAGGWSPGDYITLCFFLAVFIYIGVIVLVNWCYFQRRGVDLLPHRAMWLNLALLVKDGCALSFTVVREKFSKKSGYTEIE